MEVRTENLCTALTRLDLTGFPVGSIYPASPVVLWGQSRIKVVDLWKCALMPVDACECCSVSAGAHKNGSICNSTRLAELLLAIMAG